MTPIDLTTSKNVAKDIKEEYGSDPKKMYNDLNDQKISFSQHLENLDPSEYNEEGVRISKHDAFQRHLMSLGIETHGKNQVTIEKLFAKATHLMPELVRREVMMGMEVADRYSYKDLIAVTVPAAGLSFRPLYIPDLNIDTTANKKKYSRSRNLDHADLPVVSVRAREKDISQKDYGVVSDFSYKVLKQYAWQDYAIVLRLIGASISNMKLADIYDLAITGDGTVSAATDTFTGTDGTLAYEDLVEAYAAYGAPYTMNAMLADIDSFTAILSLSQFTDPQSGWEFQKTGKLVTPFGAKLKQVNSSTKVTVTAKELVSLDTRFAVREAISQELLIEADKIIDRKVEQAVISDETSFSIIADGALKRTVWHA